MNRVRRTGTIVGLSMLAAAVCLVAMAGSAIAAEKGKDLMVKPGAVGGLALSMTGEEITGASIVVKDATGTAVASTTTSDKGEFSLPVLHGGDYTMQVNGGEAIRLQVTEKAMCSKVFFMTSDESTQAYTAGQEGEGEGGGGGATPDWLQALGFNTMADVAAAAAAAGLTVTAFVASLCG